MRKYFLTILSASLLMGCGARLSNGRQTALYIDSDTVEETDIVWRERDSIHFFYAEPVENYRVTGTVSDYLDEWNIASLELTFHNNETHKEFTVRGGRRNWRYFLGIDSVQTDVVELHYPEIVEDGIISAPYAAPFFFADIDFDGVKELITDCHCHAGTQRDVGRFTAIYKIVDGTPQDVTNEFTAKSEVFCCMDEYFFMIIPARKEILFYHSGGAPNSGWEVHKFVNGEYIYDHYVSYFAQNFGTDDEFYEISILTPQDEVIKTFTVDKATFNKEMWGY